MVAATGPGGGRIYLSSSHCPGQDTYAFTTSPTGGAVVLPAAWSSCTPLAASESDMVSDQFRLQLAGALKASSAPTSVTLTLGSVAGSTFTPSGTGFTFPVQRDAPRVGPMELPAGTPLDSYVASGGFTATQSYPAGSEPALAIAAAGGHAAVMTGPTLIGSSGGDDGSWIEPGATGSP
jgi:hypothetical protein